MHIKVYKSKKKLHYIDQDGAVEEFDIGIGKNELGHKQHRDDLKTPEGVYKICVKNNKSDFFLSLGLNYPNESDARSALNKSTITEEQYQSILKAQQDHGGSDWSTSLGGEIYIHGGLEDKPFSEGCIRMYNKDIEKIFTKVKKGLSVEIFK